MTLSRRSLLRAAALAGAGAGAGGAAVWAVERYVPRGLPVSGGYAPAVDTGVVAAPVDVSVVWQVETTQRLVALTFDDGPGLLWTPMVLDTLDRWDVPATFFVVGRNVAAYPGLLAGRMDRHEIGNHTWSHRDLALTDRAGARREISRCTDAIRRHLGREPTLLRPPMGHLGGATVLAAGEFGYRVVLWSLQMHERTYLHDPAAQARFIVGSARPGAIVLAHDVGGPQRLVTLRHLDEMIAGLRARGFRLVTVSELLRVADPPTARERMGGT